MQRPITLVPKLLLLGYVVLFIVCAFAPYDRVTWWYENATVWIIVGVLILLAWRSIRFSNTAYILMAVLIYLHTIGGHYTFERVPFDWVTDYFGFERNHYDRLAHFSVGFYAYAMAEWIAARKLVAHKWLLYTYPIFAIATIAAVYEIIEWWYAAANAPEAAAAYLGSQGDVWDAQKDMLADTLGAIVAMVLFWLSSLTQKHTQERTKKPL